VAVAGATGRTGSEVVAEARERGHDVIALSRDPDGGDRGNGKHGGPGAGAGLRDHADLPAILADDADVLVDFTVPEATVDHAGAAAETGTPLVVGATGFDQAGMAALRQAARDAPVLKASNFARGVQALRQLVREAAGALPGYDVELTETHHSGKRDAPSGTARTLLDDVDDGRAAALDRTYGREGEQAREVGEVGVHVRRAGAVRGEHELLFAGNDELLTVTHRAESRRVFAAGAVDAAEWLVNREPGYYRFEEVLG
jgi:4-hydroxy-tetrahydrodipicolinate reductase